MSDQDGLSNDGTQTSRTDESKNGCNEMNEENNDIAHAASTTAKDDGLGPNLEFATHTSKPST